MMRSRSIILVQQCCIAVFIAIVLNVLVHANENFLHGKTITGQYVNVTLRGQFSSWSATRPGYGEAGKYTLRQENGDIVVLSLTHFMSQSTSSPPEFGSHIYAYGVWERDAVRESPRFILFSWEYILSSEGRGLQIDYNSRRELSDDHEQINVGVFLVRLNDDGTTYPTCGRDEVANLLWGTEYELGGSEFRLGREKGRTEESDPLKWSVQSFLLSETRGRVSLSVDRDGSGKHDIYGEFVVPYNGKCEPNEWAAQVDKAGTDAGFPMHLYTSRIYVLSSFQHLRDKCEWEGLGGVGCSFEHTGTVCPVWTIGCSDFQTFAHELGHNLGFAHSRIYLDENSEVIEYGDPAATMGNGFLVDHRLTHFNAPHKIRKGWVPKEQVALARSNGVYEITSFDSAEYGVSNAPSSNGNKIFYALQVIHPDTGYLYTVSMADEFYDYFEGTLMFHAQAALGGNALPSRPTYLVGMMNSSFYHLHNRKFGSFITSETGVESYPFDSTRPSFVDFWRRFSITVVSKDYAHNTVSVLVSFLCDLTLPRITLLPTAPGIVDKGDIPWYGEDSYLPVSATESSVELSMQITNLNTPLCGYSTYNITVNILKCDDDNWTICEVDSKRRMGSVPSTVGVHPLQTCTASTLQPVVNTRHDRNITSRASSFSILRVTLSEDVEDDFTRRNGAAQSGSPTISATNYFFGPNRQCHMNPLLIFISPDSVLVEDTKTVVQFYVINQDSVACESRELVMLATSNLTTVTVRKRSGVLGTFPTHMLVNELSVAAEHLATSTTEIPVTISVISDDSVIRRDILVPLCRRFPSVSALTESPSDGPITIVSGETKIILLSIQNKDVNCEENTYSLALLACKDGSGDSPDCFPMRTYPEDGNGHPPYCVSRSWGSLRACLTRPLISIRAGGRSSVAIVLGAPLETAQNMTFDFTVVSTNMRDGSSEKLAFEATAQPREECVFNTPYVTVGCSAPHNQVDQNASLGKKGRLLSCMAIIRNHDSYSCGRDVFTLSTAYFPAGFTGSFDDGSGTATTSQKVKVYPGWKEEVKFTLEYPAKVSEERPALPVRVSSVHFPELGNFDIDLSFGYCNYEPPSLSVKTVNPTLPLDDEDRPIAYSFINETKVVRLVITNNYNSFCNNGNPSAFRLNVEIEKGSPSNKDLYISSSPVAVIKAGSAAGVLWAFVGLQPGINATFSVEACDVSNSTMCSEKQWMRRVVNASCALQQPIVEFIDFSRGSYRSNSSSDNSPHLHLAMYSHGIDRSAPNSESFTLHVRIADVGVLCPEYSFRATIEPTYENPNKEYFPANKKTAGPMEWRQTCSPDLISLSAATGRSRGNFTCTIVAREMILPSNYTFLLAVDDTAGNIVHRTNLDVTAEFPCAAPGEPMGLTVEQLNTATSFSPTIRLQWALPPQRLPCCEPCMTYVYRGNYGSTSSGNCSGDASTLDTSCRELSRRGGLDDIHWQLLGEVHYDKVSFEYSSNLKEGDQYAYRVVSCDGYNRCSTHMMCSGLITVIQDSLESYFLYILSATILTLSFFVARLVYLNFYDPLDSYPYHGPSSLFQAADEMEEVPLIETS